MTTDITKSTIVLPDLTLNMHDNPLSEVDTYRGASGSGPAILPAVAPPTLVENGRPPPAIRTILATPTRTSPAARRQAVRGPGVRVTMAQAEIAVEIIPDDWSVYVQPLGVIAGRSSVGAQGHRPGRLQGI